MHEYVFLWVNDPNEILSFAGIHLEKGQTIYRSSQASDDLFHEVHRTPQWNLTHWEVARVLSHSDSLIISVFYSIAHE